MTASDRDAIEQLLRARAEALDLRLTTMSAAPERGSGISFGKRVGDGTTEAVRRLTDVGVGSTLETKHLRILRALEKLDEGTYGICDTCGQPIAPARLRFTPEATLCVTCAREAH
jgi:DnaK suppressor protein